MSPKIETKQGMKKIVFHLMMVVLLSFSQSAMAQLPAVTLKTMDGQTIKTDTLSNNGKPFIIDFFATWCKPCNRELDAINEVYADWQDETGVKICSTPTATSARPWVHR